MIPEAIIFLLKVFFIVLLVYFSPELMIYFSNRFKKKKKKEDHILNFLNRVDNTGEWVKLEGAYMRRKG